MRPAGRSGGTKCWLWDFVGDDVTVYRILDGRGYDQAKQILGEGFSGVLERDGWAAYRGFAQAAHQTCYAHLLRRCHDMIADSAGDHTRIPATVRQILKDALALRDAGDAGRVDPEQLARKVLRLGERLDLLLATDATCCEPDRKLVKHLRNERDALFTFLVVPGVAATNWRAEQAIRPAVVNRKHWGGNRTRQGADTAQVLASVLRSARQQHRDPVGILVPC
jgi:transposase